MLDEIHRSRLFTRRFGTCSFDSLKVPSLWVRTLKDLPDAARTLFQLHPGGFRGPVEAVNAPQNAPESRPLCVHNPGVSLPMWSPGMDPLWLSRLDFILLCFYIVQSLERWRINDNFLIQEAHFINLSALPLLMTSYCPWTALWNSWTCEYLSTEIASLSALGLLDLQRGKFQQMQVVIAEISCICWNPLFCTIVQKVQEP